MADLTPELKDRLLNEFGLRSLRDVADADYITARMAYRVELLPQAFWSSQQAIEKYLKGILLFRRIPCRDTKHSLVKALQRLEETFPLDLSAGERDFIAFIDGWGVDRYFILPYGSDGDELFKLDETVWALRRYCTPVDSRISPQGTPAKDLDLRQILAARDRPPHLFRTTADGVIGRELRPEGAAHEALIWKNLYFGDPRVESVEHALSSTSHNSPLLLYPDMLEELEKYVYIPKESRNFLREHRS